MAAGLQIVNRDDQGKIKQDYHAYRGDGGRVIEVDELKKAEARQERESQ